MLRPTALRNPLQTGFRSLLKPGLLLLLACALLHSSLSMASTRIELSHELQAMQADALRQLVADFNQSQTETQIDLSPRSWRSEAPPALFLLDSADAESLLGPPARIKPLHELMREAGHALDPAQAPVTLARSMVDGRNRLLALPVGLSTPVLYFNRNALHDIGLDSTQAPRTWNELQAVLGLLRERGYACPYTVAQPARVMVENLSAWHNAPISAKGEKTEELRFNTMAQIKHIALMASWYRALYLHIFDQAGEPEARFARGECALMVGPSSAWAEFRRHAAFEVGVSFLPFHEDMPGAPQNTLADGTALWASAGLSPMQYRGIAQFVRFWLEPANQARWQHATGFLPLNPAGLFTAPSQDQANAEQRNVFIAFAQLTHKPATASSQASRLSGRQSLRQIVDEELAAVWADTAAAKQALDKAVERGRLIP